MRFSYLFKYFEKLEKTSSKHAMIQTLASLLKETTVSNIDIVCYFTLGEVAAAYKNVQLGIGTEIAKSAISLTFGVEKTEVEDKLKKFGDLGTVTSKIDKAAKRKIEGISLKGKLSVNNLHKELIKIDTFGKFPQTSHFI